MLSVNVIVIGVLVLSFTTVGVPDVIDLTPMPCAPSVPFCASTLISFVVPSDKLKVMGVVVFPSATVDVPAIAFVTLTPSCPLVETMYNFA